jgi:hypothetical protein
MSGGWVWRERHGCSGISVVTPWSRGDAVATSNRKGQNVLAEWTNHSSLFL